jgi:hypothetical protein
VTVLTPDERAGFEVLNDTLPGGALQLLVLAQ